MDYTGIPEFRCRSGCADCCGPHPWSQVERDSIVAWLKEHGRAEQRATGLACPYQRPIRKRPKRETDTSQIGLCSIYPVRPLLCRLYGTVDRMRCPHGCGPDRLLTPEKEAEIMRRYLFELKEGQQHASD